MTPVVLEYMESMIGLFRAGCFSVDLTHHVLHALAGWIWGFTQEVFTDQPTPEGAAVDGEAQAAALNEMATGYPYSHELAKAIAHDQTSVVGGGCDDPRIRVRPRHPARRVRTTPPAGRDLHRAPQRSCRATGVTDTVDGEQVAVRRQGADAAGVAQAVRVPGVDDQHWLADLGGPLAAV
jgi:hypothetical protein